MFHQAKDIISFSKIDIKTPLEVYIFPFLSPEEEFTMLHSIIWFHLMERWHFYGHILYIDTQYSERMLWATCKTGVFSWTVYSALSLFCFGIHLHYNMVLFDSMKISAFRLMRWPCGFYRIVCTMAELV